MGMWAELPPGSIPVTEILEVQKRPGYYRRLCKLQMPPVPKGSC